MVKFLINRPVAVFMASLAFLLLGMVAAAKIPTSLMPDIPIPEITVQVSYPNNTARELETNIVRPLRNQLLQVGNLKDISSETRDGFAALKLSFEYGTNTNLAFVETNEKVDASLNYLPRDLERPKVIKASVTDIPIVNLTVSLKDDFSSEKFLELSDFTETVLKKRIEQLPDIALADISGLTKPEIVVTPDIQKLQSLGLDSNELINAIKRNNFELGNLLVQNGIYQYNFKFANPLKNKKDIQNIYLNIHNKLFQISDLASVKLQAEQNKGLIYVNGKRAIVLAVIKQADARVYELKESLDKVTQSLVEDYPNLEFTTNQDQTKLLQLSIDNLKSSLWLGSFLAILIMFFFLQDVKSPLIIAISIPVSLIVSIFFMYLFGLSINIISLSGLILGVGMMIDNAIIVIDNITQKLEEGSNLANACVRGTNEIITPLISSVLTTCSVFLPLLFLSGITGALFYDQALAVAIGLFSSLLVSIVLIPVIYNQLNKKTFKFEKWLQLKVQTQHIENWYEKGYDFFFKRKSILYGISTFFALLAVLFLLLMPYSQLPELNQNEVILNIDWNENITVEENQKRIASLFSEETNLQTVFSKVGEQQFLLQQENTKSFSEAAIYLKTNTIDEIEKLKNNLQGNINRVFKSATFSFEEPKNIFQYLFGNRKSALIAQVFSRSSLEVPPEESLPRIQRLLKKVSTTEIPLKQTAFIEVLHEKILLYDVSYDDLLHELKSTFNQNFVDNLKTAQKFIPIKLNYQQETFETMITDLFVKNKNNELIAVRNLIKTYPAQQYKTITANRSGEYLAFDVHTNKNIENKINEIQNVFKKQKDYNVRFDGSFFDIKALGNELLVVVLVAILLLYFIMAAQFESLWQPIIILLEIPIDIGGALLLLWLFGGTINVMSAIGIVVMSGVIINDSILKLHTINLLRKEGKSTHEAIKLGGKLRLKPILMTSLTTILALLPFLFIDGLGAELQKPLALTVIGGMLIGTFISLYFIPLMYALLSKKEVYEKST
ncbi:efflux RND transporter permease subunit [Tenacibaculum tangerinum]|uniref:Efflux RND transporter permease subunit n=1 Tax=Tenacibaculum tangerinum TaxID=3038772 RepID=A0ABY8L2A8_9FLAO|nr:efflux RND transporter permease subunit [Tenacibaculum tangerinum]WGH74114.1 efflux RND transporter permease subunit [Tenacibaculum tangerinum]